MKSYEVEIQGKTHKIFAEKISGNLWFHWKGQTFCYKNSEFEVKASGKAASVSPGLLRAPMPGKIIKVLAEEGASVSKGDKLVVMEAMKMEYTLSSDISGTVKEVDCREGGQVSLGQILVRVEE